MKYRTFTRNIVLTMMVYGGVLGTEVATAQTASINSITVTPASCSGGGSVTGIVSVPGACSVDGFLPCTNVSLHGPGQGGGSFNSCQGYQVGANNLAPGDYYYRVSAISPCSGTAEFPFTIADEGVYPDIDITTHAIDCSNDDYVTVENNSPVTVTIGELGGSSLGTIAPGQSADYPNTSVNFTLTATTSTCTTPVEYPVEYQTGPGLYPFGYPVVVANVSSVNTTAGMSNGSVTVNVTSGAGPFQFEWSNGVSEGGPGVISSTIENLAPGSYTVVVTSTHGCTYEETVIISGGPSGIFDRPAITALSVYPNPSEGVFRLDLQDTKFTASAAVSVMDNTGRVVFRATANSLQPDITLDNVAGGIYLLRVSEGNLLGSARITVSR